MDNLLGGLGVKKNVAVAFIIKPARAKKKKSKLWLLSGYKSIYCTLIHWQLTKKSRRCDATYFAEEPDPEEDVQEEWVTAAEAAEEEEEKEEGEEGQSSLLFSSVSSPSSCSASSSSSSSSSGRVLTPANARIFAKPSLSCSTDADGEMRIRSWSGVSERPTEFASWENWGRNAAGVEWQEEEEGAVEEDTENDDWGVACLLAVCEPGSGGERTKVRNRGIGRSGPLESEPDPDKQRSDCA